MTDYDTQVLALGPDGYWKLDEASGLVFADSSTGAHAATAGAGAVETYRIPGPSATQTPLATDFLNVNPPALAVGTVGQRAIGASFSVEVWVGLYGAIPTAFGFVTKGYNVVEQRPWYSLSVDTAGKVIWWFRDAGGVDYKLTSQVVINDVVYAIWGPYHHLVGTYTAGTADLYIDGVHVATLAVPNTGWGTGAQPLCFGRLAGGVWGGPWMSNVAIYPGQLSALQVASNYALGSQGSAWTTPQLAVIVNQLAVDLATVLACVRKVF